MVGQYLSKKPKCTFCYSVLKRQFFLTSKQGLIEKYAVMVKMWQISMLLVVGKAAAFAHEQ
jgi:hypothetical protein